MVNLDYAEKKLMLEGWTHLHQNQNLTVQSLMMLTIMACGQNFHINKKYKNKEYIGHFMTNDFTVVPFSEDTG